MARTTVIPTDKLIAELTHRIATARKLYFTNAEHQRRAATKAERESYRERCTQLAGQEHQLLSMLDWARTWQD